MWVRWLVITILLLVGAVGSHWWFTVDRPEATVISFLDVGQGDGIHIRTAEGFDVVIDGGPDDRIVAELGETIPFWDRTIELLVLSHPDADHVTGLVPLFEYYDIQQVMMVGLSSQSAVHEQFLENLQTFDTEVIYPLAGDTYELNGWEVLEVLHPFSTSPVESMDRNDTSIVLEYRYPGTQNTSVLLTGDISKQVEHDLVQAGVVPDTDIMKVPHHGSKSSSSADFLQAAQPEVSIVQSGADNRFGHPHAEVLQRLYPFGPVVRNDEWGTVQVRIEDEGYSFVRSD